MHRWLRCFAILVAVALVLTVFNGSFLLLVFAAPPSTASSPGGGSNTTLPPSPPPLRVAHQAIVPPGTITHAASNLSASDLALTIPLNVTETVDGVRVTASYGKFVIEKETPSIVSLFSGDQLVQNATFTVSLADGRLLKPGQPESVVGFSSGFRATYDLFSGAQNAGTMSVVYNFTKSSDKITVRFAPSKGGPSGESILWLLFSPLPYVTTASLSNPVQPFSAISAQPGWEFDANSRTLSTDSGALKEIGDWYWNATFSSSPDQSLNVNNGFFDALTAYNGTFANAGNSFSYANQSGNVVAVSFLTGNLTIDPTQGLGWGPTGNTQGASYTVQRKVIFDGSNYWAFADISGSIQ